MENAAGVSPKQAAAVAALAGVDAVSAGTLHECFRHFGIDTVAIAAQDAARLAHERFDACVLPLDDRAEQVLTTIRQSPDNAHCVIYAICGGLPEAIRFSAHGINALFFYPVQRDAALLVVRTTQLMVLHQLRRYVRVPLITGVMVETGREKFSASTVEISSGGISMYTRARLAVPQSVQVNLQLPRAGQLSLRAVVCWMRSEEELAGLRFEPGDPHRAQLRQWIEGYLGED
jgi:hypothetical protein